MAIRQENVLWGGGDDDGDDGGSYTTGISRGSHRFSRGSHFQGDNTRTGIGYADRAQGFAGKDGG